MTKRDRLQQLHVYNVEAVSATAARARSLHAVGEIATFSHYVILSVAERSRRSPRRKLEV